MAAKAPATRERPEARHRKVKLSMRNQYTQETPETTTANIVLMGLEARSRAAYEELLADHWRHDDRLPSFETLERYEASETMTVVVTYHPLRSWSYEFSSIGWLRGRFDTRESCLGALEKHMAVLQ